MQKVFQMDSSKLDWYQKQVSSAVLSFGVKGWMAKCSKDRKPRNFLRVTAGNIYSNSRGRQLARNDS